MKFTIMSKGDQSSDALASTMKEYLLDFGFIMDEKEPDIVISVGGDGTLLYAFHRYYNRLDETAFVGVHTGHLGFYADWLPTEVEKLVIAIAKTPFQVVEYPLLEVIIRYVNGSKESQYLAMNEATVKSAEGTLVTEVEIRGEYFETFRCGMAFVFLLLREVLRIIRRLAEQLFTLLLKRFKLRKWHLLITGCFVR